MCREIRKTMKVLRSARRSLAAVLLTILLPVSGAQIFAQQHSQPQHAQAGDVSLVSLIEAALAAHPELTAMRREFDAARARIPQAKALPDPTVTFMNMTVSNPVPFTGNNDGFAENNIGFSQEFPWFGVRRLRGQVASAEAEAKFQVYAATVLRLTSDVKAAYYDLYYTDRALAVLARDQDILDKVAQVAEARYSVGKAQQVDVINVRVESTELLDKQGLLEAKRAIAAAQLNQLLYRDPETPIEKLAAVQMSPEPPPLAELARLAEANAPDLKQLRHQIDGNNKSLRLAEREAKYPEVGVNFTYHNRPLFSDYYTYGVTLRLPLYTATKQRYAIKEQAANLAATQARLDTNLSLIRYKLREARVRATTAARLIKLHEQGLIPQATLALESALSAYQVGQVEMLTLLTTLKRALDYETRYYELLSDYQKALAEMERFTGVELTR
jgi:outer membrane protein, heavy metal efflux system